MELNFDQIFEHYKPIFKIKSGVEWSDNPHLYLIYLQTIHLSNFAEITELGCGSIIARLDDTKELLLILSQKLNK
jgi:hypothetical protein